MSSLRVLLRYNKQEGDWEERKREEGDLSRRVTAFRNHQKIREMWGGGEPGKQCWREEKVERDSRWEKKGWQDSSGASREERGEEEERGMQGTRRGRVHNVWGKTSVTVQAPAYPSDLFYPPSACWTRDEERLMNNRGGGEMDENEAAFLSFTSPSFTARLLSLSCDPLF